MTNTAYEPSQDFCTKILAKLGVTTGWFDPLIGAISPVWSANTAWCSSNPRLHHHGSP
jgi:cystathionine beta-lyase/cystathionine gamma-synthase